MAWTRLERCTSTRRKLEVAQLLESVLSILRFARARLPHDHAGLHERGRDGHGFGAGDARAHAKLLKSKLQVSSFQIGYDEPTYVSAMHEGHPPSTWPRLREFVEGMMDDFRRYTRPLGEDEVVYETDMMRSMRNGEITPEFIQCMKEDKAQADALAAELKIDRRGGSSTGVYPE